MFVRPCYREGMTDLVAKVEVQSIPFSPAFSGKTRPRKFPLVAPLAAFQSDRQHGHRDDTIEVSNQSARTLSSTAPCQIFASYHWKSMDDSVVLRDGCRSPLPQDLWPSEKTPLSILVLLPPAPGALEPAGTTGARRGALASKGPALKKHAVGLDFYARDENGRYDLVSEVGSVADV